MEKMIPAYRGLFTAVPQPPLKIELFKYRDSRRQNQVNNYVGCQRDSSPWANDSPHVSMLILNR